MQQFLSKYFKYFVLAALIYMPVFGHLDSLPIRIWDEARRSINAYEMLNNGNFLVTHFQGEPDMWGTKPPMLVWLQVFFMSIIGINELAVRMPSAMAAFLTSVVLLVFSLKYLRSFWFGFIAVVVLITSQGYINFHAARTGDYDALLALFTTLSGLLFFAFTETKKNKFLYLFFLFTAFAVLTKSVAGLFFIPAIFLYSIITKQLIPLLKSKHFYYGLASFLILVLGYYLLREVYNPGYLAAVQANELGGRYMNALETHGHGFWYYYNNFVEYRITEWMWFIPCGIITGFIIKDKRVNRLTVFSVIMIFTFFLVISTAQTKLRHYDVPLFPFLAILIAVFIYYVFQWLDNVDWFKHTLAINLMPFIFLFLVGIVPYQKMIDKTYLPQEKYPWEEEFYEIGYFLKSAIKGQYDLNDKYILYDGYNAHVAFYLHALNHKGVNVSFKDWQKLDTGDTVVAYQNQVKQYVEENYEFDKIYTRGNIATYVIGEKKE